MSNYTVTVPEIHWSVFTVEADSREDAVKRVKEGEGIYEGEDGDIDTLAPSEEYPWYVDYKPYTGEDDDNG